VRYRCGLGRWSGDLVFGKRQKCLDCESDDGLRRAGLENEGRGGTCAGLIDSVYLPTCLLVHLVLFRYKTPITIIPHTKARI
jgi:hypothetical protein